MTRYRVLIVDDEDDVRTVVELSLVRDPQLTTRTCACGGEALAAAADWSPDLIVLDVMMPGMDGPTTLARLRENPATARIPVVFLTARARAAELEHFRSLGARGAIAKPFVPKELQAAIRAYLGAAAPTSDQRGEQTAASPQPSADRNGADPLMSEAELRTERDDFLARLGITAATLAALRAALKREPASANVLDDLRTVAHRTAGSAGLYGFDEVSIAAARLEDSIIARRDGNQASALVDTDIEALLSTIGREPASTPCG